VTPARPGKKAKNQRGRKPRLVGRILGLAGAAAIAVGVVSTVGFVNEIRDAPHLENGTTVVLEADTEYGVFTDSGMGFDLQVTDPSGDPVDLEEWQMNQIEVNNYDLGVAFEAEEAGDYTFHVTGDAGTLILLPTSVAFLIALAVTCYVLGGLAIGAAILLLVIAAILRHSQTLPKGVRAPAAPAPATPPPAAVQDPPRPPEYRVYE
jgi:hypothetical protein